MALLIGIIARCDNSQKGHNISFAYDDIMFSIKKSGGIPLIIPSDNIYDYLDICSGFIFQGGDDINKIDLNILKVLRDKKIPTLGICLGMQEMGIYYGGRLVDIKGHYGNKKHIVYIKKDSLLYKILGVEKIIVNSRHNSSVIDTKIKVGAISSDGIIEAIEDEETNFLGIQWHPENMYDEEFNAKKIFDYFLKMCNDNACK